MNINNLVKTLIRMFPDEDTWIHREPSIFLEDGTERYPSNEDYANIYNMVAEIKKYILTSPELKVENIDNMIRIMCQFFEWEALVILSKSVPAKIHNKHVLDRQINYYYNGIGDDNLNCLAIIASGFTDVSKLYNIILESIEREAQQSIEIAALLNIKRPDIYKAVESWSDPYEEHLENMDKKRRRILMEIKKFELSLVK